MAAADRLERLTDLVLVLLNATTPRTLSEIAHAVPGYPDGHEARRQAFERDKRVLRDEGIPVATEPVDGPEQFGYRIHPAAFYLPDLALTGDEQAALHLAVAGVHLGDPSGRDALAKLGAAGSAESRPVAALVPPAALVPLFDALRAVAEVRFGYRGARRVVVPSTLRFRGGRWYLVGWDRTRGAGRTFRVDRLEEPIEAGPPGSGQLPEGYDAGAGPADPWRPVEGEEDDPLLVRVDAVEGPRVAAEVGEDKVTERGADGSVVLRLGVTTMELLRSWVLALLDHAEVLGPEVARRDVVAWLEATAADPGVPGASARGPGSSAAGPAPAEAAHAASAPPAAAAPTAPASAPPAAAEPVPDAPEPKRALPASVRLRRLLAVVGWLATVGEASIDEIAARFDIPAGEVTRELELAACCGVPPYTPDTLLEIFVDADTVRAFLPADLSRPRRLTPAEGLALATSARTILAVPGADPNGALGRALAKLDSALGDHRRVVIELDAPPALAQVRALVEGGTQGRIEYHSTSTDETTERVVEPLGVVSLDGHWYLDAYCHRAEGIRRFRVDRIRTVEPFDEPVRHRPEWSPGGRDAAAFVPGASAAIVELQLDHAARWVLETVPALSVTETPDGPVVTLAVGGTAWLERLLLQLGPNARVLSPEDLREVGPQAARKVLRRYQGAT